jgi:hypothetical protein
MMINLIEGVFMDDIIKKVWISKYALTTGVYEQEVKIPTEFPEMCHPVDTMLQHFHKGDWFLTREEAVARAEDLRKKKIAAVKNQLKKLEGMTF